MFEVLEDQGVVFSFNKHTAGFVGSRDSYEDWGLVKGCEGGYYATGINMDEEELVRVYKVSHSVRDSLGALASAGYCC